MDFYAELVAPPIFKAEQDNLITVQPVKEQVTVKSTLVQQIVTPSTLDRVIDEITVQPIVLQSKTATPIKASQNVVADENYDGLGEVNIEPIPDNYIDTSDATATENDIISGQTAYVNGEKLTGTLDIFIRDTIEKDINFYDYRGELVKSYDFSDLPLSVLPTAPTFDGLTFQEWNYSLNDINNATEKLDIGTTYTTTDGKVHAFLSFPTDVNNTYSINWQLTSTTGGTIDFGDGAVESFGTGNSTITHDFTSGNHEVIIDAINLGFRNYAFNGGSLSGYNNGLKEIRFGNSVSNFAFSTFVRSVSLEYVVISNSINSLNNTTFQYCYNLKSVVIPKNIISVDSTTFSNCSSLQKIIMPASVTSIGSNILSSCPSLRNLVISSNVSSVGTSAFQGCTSLISVVISDSVLSIGNNAFYQNYTLSIVKLLSSEPPILANSSVFNNNHASRLFFIPAGSLNAYERATNWATYAGSFVEY